MRDTIEINGIDAIVQFSRYNPKKPDIFLSCMELARDLVNQSGILLYAKGTKISQTHIYRLLKVLENKPKIKFSFKIKKSDKIIQELRDEIKERIDELLKRRQGSKVFRDLLSPIIENIESFIDEIFSEKNITLSIYKLMLIGESSRAKRSVFFVKHLFDVMMISLGIALSERYAEVVDKDKAKLIEICKVSLFHNYGALTDIETILEAPEDERFKLYWNANQNWNYLLGNLQFSSDIVNAIRLLCEYYMGKKDFINSTDWPATMVNIVLVAEAFLQKESGLFKKPQPVNKVIDQLNVRMAEKVLNEMAVQALTLGLNLQDIFDFYHELDCLKKECPYDSGVPYPLTGFKSPTIFVCNNEDSKCKHIETSHAAINLIKSPGELKPGKYHRCLLLSRKLNAFYNKHYDDIKKPHDHQV